MKKQQVFKLSILIYIIIIALLTIQQSTGRLLRFQSLFDVSIITMMFWILVTSISVWIMVGDNGFLKIGAAFGVLLGIYTFVFYSITSPTDFQSLSSNDHVLLLEYVETSGTRYVNIYEKENLLFSEFVGKINIASHYAIEFEIDGDEFVVHKCTDLACQESRLDLE